ncbi:MAG: recombinase family protein, partial [Proteobacteria bacterium]|nr:recombinase family protein [Pseudomonadota bacterium]
YAELYDAELVDVVVDEGVSAGTALEKRPGGAELLDRLRDGEAEGVVFQRIDRVFRMTVDGLVTAAWFNRLGLSLHSVNEHINSGTPDGWLSLTILLATAEYERNKIKQRATETSAGLREQGKAWGPTPFGCMRVGDKLYRDPETWVVRKSIVDMRTGLSLRAICTELREWGIPAPSGGRLWHTSTLKGIIDTHHTLEHIPDLPSAPETRISLVGKHGFGEQGDAA